MQSSNLISLEFDLNKNILSINVDGEREQMDFEISDERGNLVHAGSIEYPTTSVSINTSGIHCLVVLTQKSDIVWLDQISL